MCEVSCNGGDAPQHQGQPSQEGELDLHRHVAEQWSGDQNELLKQG